MLDLDARLPASQAARAVRVSKQLFNHWRRRGAIVACGTRDGRPVYRLGDVLAVEVQMRNTTRSSRAPIAA